MTHTCGGKFGDCKECEARHAHAGRDRGRHDASQWDLVRAVHTGIQAQDTGTGHRHRAQAAMGQHSTREYACDRIAHGVRALYLHGMHTTDEMGPGASTRLQQRITCHATRSKYRRRTVALCV